MQKLLEEKLLEAGVERKQLEMRVRRAVDSALRRHFPNTSKSIEQLRSENSAAVAESERDLRALLGAQVARKEGFLRRLLGLRESGDDPPNQAGESGPGSSGTFRAAVRGR